MTGDKGVVSILGGILPELYLLF